MMKGLKILVLAIVLVLGLSITSLYAEEHKETHKVETQKDVTLQHSEKPPVSGSASVGVFNRYIFRGYEISSHSLVVQPTISVSYKWFSATL